jgi:hypothetical protein
LAFGWRSSCRPTGTPSTSPGAAGTFSTENTKLIEDLVGRAPITTKQFVEDLKAALS